MYLNVSTIPPNSLILEVEDCETAILIKYKEDADLTNIHVEAAELFALFCKGILESSTPEPRVDGKPGFRFKILLQKLH